MKKQIVGFKDWLKDHFPGSEGSKEFGLQEQRNCGISFPVSNRTEFHSTSNYQVPALCQALCQARGFRMNKVLSWPSGVVLLSGLLIVNSLCERGARLEV